MATKYIGYDGGVTIGTGNTYEIKQGSLTVSRVVTDVSGFNNRGRERRLGKWDLRLAWSGTPQAGSVSPIAQQTATGFTTQFRLSGGTATTGTFVTFESVVEEVQLGSVHDADATVSGTVSLSTQITSEPPFTVTWSAT